MTKHDGHPLDHLDHAVVEAGGIALEDQHNRVSVVDRVRQGRHHLFDQNFILIVRIVKARGVHNLDKIIVREYKIKLTVKFCPFPSQGP